eukprot:6915994-Pyramimonas_sp.AAC.1
MPGILVDQELSFVSEESARCSRGRNVELRNICVAEALRDIGFAVSRARSGPLWVVKDRALTQTPRRARSGAMARRGRPWIFRGRLRHSGRRCSRDEAHA